MEDLPEDQDKSGDRRNVEQLRFARVAWLSLLADSPLRKTHGDRPQRLVARFDYELRGDLIGTIIRYASLADELSTQTTIADEGTSTGAFLKPMLDTPVAKEYVTWYRDRDVKCFAYVYEFLVFLKKLPYDDPKLQTRALRSWLAVEERLSGLELPDWTDDLRLIVGRLVDGDFSEAYHVPKHGPGRVAEPSIRGVVEKSNSVSYVAKIDRAFYGSGSKMVFGLKPENGFDRDYAIPSVDRWNKAGIEAACSVLKFVYKNMKTYRSICMEPVTFMLHQQSFMRILLGMVSRGYGKHFIRLEDQGRNRTMSRYGSETGWIDTLDLSAASDSVSVDLVRRIFPRRVLYFLLATRTSKVLYAQGYVKVKRSSTKKFRYTGAPKDLKTRVISVRKFAPMGSALCFPVQCIVFLSAVIRSAICVAEGQSWDEPLEATVVQRYLEDPRRLFRPYHTGSTTKFLEPAVYGDDLVVDGRLTAHLIPMLDRLGFQVNTGKSFRGDQAFRESCGGYYLMGEDVKPLYYSVANEGTNTPQWLASVVDLVNRAGDAKRGNLARVTHALLRSKYDDILYTDDRDVANAVYSTHPRNDHLPRRRNKYLHRVEYRSVSLTERKGKPSTDDTVEKYLYVQYWNSHLGRSYLSESSGSRLHPGDARVTRRWTPAWELDV